MNEIDSLDSVDLESSPAKYNIDKIMKYEKVGKSGKNWIKLEGKLFLIEKYDIKGRGELAITIGNQLNESNESDEDLDFDFNYDSDSDSDAYIDADKTKKDIWVKLIRKMIREGYFQISDDVNVKNLAKELQEKVLESAKRSLIDAIDELTRIDLLAYLKVVTPNLIIDVINKQLNSKIKIKVVKSPDLVRLGVIKRNAPDWQEQSIEEILEYDKTYDISQLNKIVPAINYKGIGKYSQKITETDETHRKSNSAKMDLKTMGSCHRRPVFADSFFRFMKLSGTPILEIPKINGRQLDLFVLYRDVTGRGGYEEVTRKNRWKTVAENLGIGGNSKDVAILKIMYKQYLHAYECEQKSPSLIKNMIEEIMTSKEYFDFISNKFGMILAKEMPKIDYKLNKRKMLNIMKNPCLREITELMLFKQELENRMYESNKSLSSSSSSSSCVTIPKKRSKIPKKGESTNAKTKNKLSLEKLMQIKQVVEQTIEIQKQLQSKVQTKDKLIDQTESKVSSKTLNEIRQSLESSRPKFTTEYVLKSLTQNELLQMGFHLFVLTFLLFSAIYFIYKLSLNLFNSIW
ncbi:PREDICTED: uncharacterized protein LOC107066734 [Polistes dominula]|uniref:Uncharacterized protein LOC107066734 n=1 Tax=Polistes dominula TaxID=743375 RepID=A0ABM1IA89_POLDO|nr:PREDICTED: uncharacterized protein LOC107066734 [Polistes dominula]